MNLHETNRGGLNPEELFIFERMAAGDQHALRFFFDKYYNDLCNYVNLYIHNPSASEDIVQELFIYLWEKREIIKLNTSVKAYLFQASRHKYLNFLRSEKSHHKIEQEVSVNEEVLVMEGDISRKTLQMEEIISASIEKLPPRCREVYLLHKNEELSYKEIASQMNISVKTVENQMTIALRKLKELLTPYYDQIFALLLIGFFVA